LAWASFPCQDLSLAGGGAGLRGERSGTFWPFWERMKGLAELGLGPRIIALENVCGTLTSHNGKDFSAIFSAFSQIGYNVGAMVVDAAKFLPQSRPRLFIICVHKDVVIPQNIVASVPNPNWHPRALLNAHEQLEDADDKWVWWDMPSPSKRKKSLRNILDMDGADLAWHSQQETREIISMMNETNREKLRKAKKLGKPTVGTMYRRTRYEAGIGKVQRIEVRFDGKAGCLRTPAGGSSRQLVILVDGQRVRTRLMQPLETARLMGLTKKYTLPENFNEALHLTGDGVAVPVVQHIADTLFSPILAAATDLDIAA
jgi:DNA (cytosine-5)-methyltransferase 1